MKLENGVFEENYVTSFSQTGVHKVLTNKSILSFMEIVAGAHSAYSNYSFDDLAKQGLSWVILNWKLKVFKRPHGEEKIRIQTWGRFRNKAFVIRDFKLFDAQNELCAIASSKWCLIDTLNHKIAQLPENIEDIYGGFREESVFGIEDIHRLSLPKTDPIDVDTYKIRRFDIDINMHVHNTNYINFAYELLPLDIFMGDELNNLSVMYKKEIKFGETIKSFLYEDNGIYRIVTKSEDEKILHSIVKLY